MSDRSTGGASGPRSPDHPDRLADLGERADGAHEEFVDTPTPGGTDEPPGRTGGSSGDAGDSPGGTDDAPGASGGRADASGNGRADAGSAAGQHRDADAGTPAASGTGTAASGTDDTASGPPPTPRVTVEGPGGPSPAEDRRTRPIVYVVGAVLILTGLIYLLMMLGVFTAS